MTNTPFALFRHVVNIKPGSLSDKLVTLSESVKDVYILGLFFSLSLTFLNETHLLLNGSLLLIGGMATQSLLHIIAKPFLGILQEYQGEIVIPSEITYKMGKRIILGGFVKKKIMWRLSKIISMKHHFPIWETQWVNYSSCINCGDYCVISTYSQTDLRWF